MIRIMKLGNVSLLILLVTCWVAGALSKSDLIRAKRGAAYAGSHPGNGYGTGGVGIPGVNNALEYMAYNQLLHANSHGGGGGGGGYGGSSHGRKLTVDQAIGMYGGHTQSRSYPYTASHSQSSSGGSGGGGSGGGGGYGG